MPLTLTLTEGVLPSGSEKETFARLTQSMLKWHGLTGNKVITPNIVGSIQVVPKGATFSGASDAPVVFIEWKVPSFVFATREIQEGYIKEATDIVHEASNGIQPKERIWVNVVHIVDGTFGVAGMALTNAQLKSAAAG